MSVERWVRFLPCDIAWLPIETDLLIVPVSIQLRHYWQIGVSKQSELTGPGVADAKFQSESAASGGWSFDDAVSYCAQELRSFNEQSWKNGAGASGIIIDLLLSTLDGVELGRPIQTDRGRLCVEVIIPKNALEIALQKADTNIFAYLLLKACGMTCLQENHLHFQPKIFRDWFFETLSGARTAPAKQPKSWRLLPRDIQIYYLLQSLDAKGVNTFKSDTTPNGGSLDAVAVAALKVRLPGVTGYSTVKIISKRVADDYASLVGIFTK